jgi:hypothetical protein
VSQPADLAAPTDVPISIDGLGFMSSYSKMQRRPLVSVEDSFDATADPGERIPLKGQKRRLIGSFHHGAGQEFQDHEGSDGDRYWQSYAVSTKTVGRAVLLPEIETILTEFTPPTHTPAAAGPYSCIASTDSVSPNRYFYFEAGGDVFKIDLDNIGAGATQVYDFADGVPFGIAPVAGYVYIATVNGLWRTEVGALVVGSTQVTGVSCTGVAWANGFLLQWSGDTISLVTNLAGAPAATVTAIGWSGAGHPEGGYWTVVTDAPGAIYAAHLAPSGRSRIYAWTDLDDFGTLGTPVVVGTLEDYEVCWALKPVGGDAVLAVGTSRGFALAAVETSGSLIIGSRVQIHSTERTADQPTGGPFEATGFAVVGGDLLVAGAVSSGALGWSEGLVLRAGLADFTANLVPAWSREWPIPAQEVHVVPKSDDANTYLVVLLDLDQTDNNVYVRVTEWMDDYSDQTVTRDRVNEGQLYTGWITFGQPDLYQPLEIVVYHETIPSGGDIACELVDQAGVRYALTGVPEGENATTFDARGVDAARRYRIGLTLVVGTNGVSPVINGGIGFRVLALDEAQDEIIAALQLAPIFNGHDMTEHAMSPADVIDHLRTAARERRIVEYVEGSLTENVVIKGVGYGNGDMHGFHYANDTDAALIGTLRVWMVTV